MEQQDSQSGQVSVERILSKWAGHYFPLKIIHLYLFVFGWAEGQSGRLTDLTFSEGRALCDRHYARASNEGEESEDLDGFCGLLARIQSQSIKVACEDCAVGDIINSSSAQFSEQNGSDELFRLGAGD